MRDAIGEGPIFLCTECGKIFGSKGNLNQHYAQDHMDLKKGANAPHRKLFQTIVVADGAEVMAPR
jgi:hypothetical protein